MSGYRYAVGKINAHGIFENLFKNQRHFKDEAYARRVLENNQEFINDELVVQKVHALSPEMALREEIESLKAQLEATKKELGEARAETELALTLLRVTEKELELEREVVDFYANENHWDDRILLELSDEENGFLNDYCGGKRARARVRERKWKS